MSTFTLEEIRAARSSSVENLKSNKNKPLMNALTMIAEENSPHVIVEETQTNLAKFPKNHANPIAKSEPSRIRTKFGEYVIYSPRLERESAEQCKRVANGKKRAYDDPEHNIDMLVKKKKIDGIHRYDSRHFQNSASKTHHSILFDERRPNSNRQHINNLYQEIVACGVVPTTTANSLEEPTDQREEMVMMDDGDKDNDNNDVILIEVPPPLITINDDDDDDCSTSTVPPMKTEKIEFDDGFEEIGEVINPRNGGGIKNIKAEPVVLDGAAVDLTDAQDSSAELEPPLYVEEPSAPREITVRKELESTIDGNLDLESMVPITIGTEKIKINIKKPIIAKKNIIKKNPPVNNIGIVVSPPPVELQPVSLKPALRNVTLTKLPTVKRDFELSGICSIM